VDGVVGLAAVAVFHDGHARTAEIGQFLLGDFEHLEREGGGSGVEVVGSAHDVFLPWICLGVAIERAS
jgi:hypothetical protein